jgi:hypothetical protein
MGLLAKGSQSTTCSTSFLVRGSIAHYLLRDTSSGQMNSEQSLVAGTRSHGKFFWSYRNKVTLSVGTTSGTIMMLITKGGRSYWQCDYRKPNMCHCALHTLAHVPHICVLS